jgi:hypothetical protein
MGRPLAVTANAGQVFADLLLLATSACHACAAVLSVPKRDRTWNTLASGLESNDRLNDRRLLGPRV